MVVAATALVFAWACEIATWGRAELVLELELAPEFTAGAFIAAATLACAAPSSRARSFRQRLAVRRVHERHTRGGSVRVESPALPLVRPEIRRRNAR